MIHRPPEPTDGELAALARIDRLQRDLRYYVAERRRWVGSVRRVMAARAIQASNAIEGYHVSVEDAVAAIAGDDPTEAKDDDWDAVTGYRRAMTYVLQLARDAHFEYTSTLLRSLHFMMTEHALDAGPGLWRPGAIWIRNDATGEIVYEGPDAENVPVLVAELVDELASNRELPTLVGAAMAHLNLAMIHPFRDGNGRMARCLQTLVLARGGILVAEFASIEEYLGTHTQDYYRVLGEVGQGTWSPSRDARPWIEFCLRAHYFQAASVLRRVRESERIWGELETLIARHRLHPRSIAALYDATIGLRVRNASYRTVLRTWDEGVSDQVAMLDLRAMARAGLLQQQGKTRGTTYVAAEPLVELRARVREERTPIDASGLFDPLDKVS